MSVMDGATKRKPSFGPPYLAPVAHCQCYPLAPAMSNKAGPDGAACLPLGEEWLSLGLRG